MRLRIEFDTGPTVDAPVTPGVGAGPVPNPAKVEVVRGLLRDAHAKVQAEGIDDVERRKRGNWLGGALRVYKELTGLTDMDDLAQQPAPPQDASALVPGARFRKVDTSVRPPRHAGAQRPVPQEVLDAEAAEEDQASAAGTAIEPAQAQDEHATAAAD